MKGTTERRSRWTHSLRSGGNRDGFQSDIDPTSHFTSVQHVSLQEACRHFPSFIDSAARLWEHWSNLRDCDRASATLTSRTSASLSGEPTSNFSRFGVCILTCRLCSVDFNVPLDGDKITNNAVRPTVQVPVPLHPGSFRFLYLQRIVGALPTVKHALDQGKSISI